MLPQMEAAVARLLWMELVWVVHLQQQHQRRALHRAQRGRH